MTEYKMRGGELVPLSAADLAQRAADAQDPPVLRRMVPLAAVQGRILALNATAAVQAVLDADPPALALWLTLVEGIWADDAQARALFTAAGLDPDVILA